MPLRPKDVDMAETENAEVLSALENYLKNISAGKRGELSQLYDFLEGSEKRAASLLNSLITGDSNDADIEQNGDIEAGFFLHWVHNMPEEVASVIDGDKAFGLVHEIFKQEAPESTLLDEHKNLLSKTAGGVLKIADDGTLYGFAKYEQLDPRWLITVYNYAINKIHPKSIKPFPVPGPNNEPLHIEGKHGDGPVIGIIGDWGAGYYDEHQEGVEVDCPAKRTMDTLVSNNLTPRPRSSNSQFDYLIHLGDVYYAGTQNRPFKHEEQENLVDVWPDHTKIESFTLNSNHEMYGAAKGYFNVALNSNGPFTPQDGQSYFALAYEKWLIIGLDSAYYSDAENGWKLYMDGAIGVDKHREMCENHIQQIHWLSGFKGHDGPIMIMTHHNPCTFAGEINGNKLYTQVQDALGTTPAVWYYGHVHNGVVYDKLFLDKTRETTVNTKARCCGHGAIPFGKATAFADPSSPISKNVSYYAHTPDPQMGSPRVKNGYACVTLKPDGGFSEAFYEMGDNAAIFKRDWDASEVNK